MYTEKPIETDNVTHAHTYTSHKLEWHTQTCVTRRVFIVSIGIMTATLPAAATAPNAKET